MSFCTQYEGQVPAEHLNEFLSLLTTQPETTYPNGEWVTDGWNQRGWDELLTATQTIASKYNTNTSMDVYYEDGDTMYHDEYSCIGEDTIEHEYSEEREDTEDW